MYVETSNVNGLRIHLVGLCSESREGGEATGSAAALTGADVGRAYFELLERTGLLDALRAPKRGYALRNDEGLTCGWVSHENLFPSSPEPELWRYAKSNGVALGPSFVNACERAEWELIERERILRSWYGETRPVSLDGEDLGPCELREVYDFRAYRFLPAH
ncbi:MAG TPA: YcaO-like family protein, partial [Polyangiaceae bacterium]|nr:YcaO-like family protein [Polyangiaceae bacterium]